MTTGICGHCEIIYTEPIADMRKSCRGLSRYSQVWWGQRSAAKSRRGKEDNTISREVMDQYSSVFVSLHLPVSLTHTPAMTPFEKHVIFL